MPASADIYGAIQQPRPVNRLAELANVMQIQGLQQQGELGRMKMDEFRRDREDNNALRAAIGAGEDAGNALMRLGRIKEAAEFRKSQTDARTAETTADAAKFKLATERYDYFKQDMAALLHDPNLSKDLVVQRGQALVQQGILPREMYDGAIANMPDDPSQLRARIEQGLKTKMTPEQIFTVFSPKVEKIDTGGQILTRDMNPNSATFGQNVGGAPVPKEQSPDNKASVGASLANAAATREVAAATRDAAKIKDNRETEMKLGDDYRAQSKPFKEVADAHRTIITALDQATTSPAATLAGATKFMKLLDPGSVVRESELGMALAASGVFDRAMNYVNVLQRGKVLTPTQAQDFKNVANQIYAAAQKQQQTIDAHYNNQAKTYGLRPEMVIQDLGQNKAAPAVSTGREASGTVAQGPSIFDQADAILKGR